MKVSTLRESMTMASPSPRELEEELMAAGSEPGNLWVPDAGWRGGWVEVGRACAALLFCFGGGRWEAHEVRGVSTGWFSAAVDTHLPTPPRTG